MPPLRFPMAVVMQRVPLANRWVSEQWQAACVLPGGPDAPAVERIGDDAAGTRWRFAGHAIELHRSESEGYYLNITSPEPKVFVMWRMVDGEPETGGEPKARPELVTVSYNEAARLLDGGEQVDAVPMPSEVLAWIQPFVAEHYKPEPRRKVKRNELYERADARRDIPGGERRK